MPRQREWRRLFVFPLQNVFWVTYNCSYKYAYVCAFMRAFLEYATPNH